jgi:hypothetical protein
LNVALTRARHLLIAVGCAVTLGGAGPTTRPGPGLGLGPGEDLVLPPPFLPFSKHGTEEGEAEETQTTSNWGGKNDSSVNIDNKLNKNHSNYNFHLKMIIDDVRQRKKIFSESEIFGSGICVSSNHDTNDYGRKGSSYSYITDVHNRYNKNDDKSNLYVNSSHSNKNDNYSNDINDDNNNSSNYKEKKNCDDENDQNNRNYSCNNTEKDYEKNLKIRLEELKSILKKNTPILPVKEQQVIWIYCM